MKDGSESPNGLVPAKEEKKKAWISVTEPLSVGKQGHQRDGRRGSKEKRPTGRVNEWKES